MEELNVSQWLVFKKPEEDGPLVRGGRADALVVHATNAVKNGKHLKLKLKIKIFKSYHLKIHKISYSKAEYLEYFNCIKIEFRTSYSIS